METRDQSTPAPGDREAVAVFAERFRRGEKMVDIFGVDEETMSEMESQAYRLYRNDRYDQARVACRGVLALDEDRPLMLLLMGDMALKEFRFSSAVKHLEKAHRLVPDHPLIRARLGEALLKARQPEAARTHLEAVADETSTLSAADKKRCRALLKALD